LLYVFDLFMLVCSKTADQFLSAVQDLKMLHTRLKLSYTRLKLSCSTNKTQRQSPFAKSHPSTVKMETVPVCC